jgi:hypothetical protein
MRIGLLKIIKRFFNTNDDEPIAKCLKEINNITSKDLDMTFSKSTRNGPYFRVSKIKFQEAYEKCFGAPWPG